MSTTNELPTEWTKESPINESLNFVDFVAIVSAIIALPGVMVCQLIANLFKGSKRRTLTDSVINIFLKHFFDKLSFKQLRLVSLDSPMRNCLDSWLYKLMFARRGLNNYNKHFCCQGVDARWIHEIPDRQPTDPVVLYFHGGGYVIHMALLQGLYICQLARDLKPYRVSILALDYSVAPFFKNPVQRYQSVLVLKELLKTCNKPILLGDSCGAHMALTVMLEEEKISPNDVLGIALVSPVTDPLATSGSMSSKTDFLPKRVLHSMMSDWLQEDDFQAPKTSPIKYDHSVWQRVLPKNVCMVYGEDECMRDQIELWASIADVETVFMEHNGTHDCILRSNTSKPSLFITDNIVKWVTEYSVGQF